MTRVTRPGGRVLVSSPNRWFPLDLFHGRGPDQPFPLWNPPWRRFLLSAGDYRALFGLAGCRDWRALPVKNYWGFHRLNQTRRGRLLAAPVKTVFALSSLGGFGWLRTTPVNPWLVLVGRKPA
jgi:hypothetical protein